MVLKFLFSRPRHCFFIRAKFSSSSPTKCSLPRTFGGRRNECPRLFSRRVIRCLVIQKPLNTLHTSTCSRSNFSRISSIITSMGVAVEISRKPERLPPNIKATGLPSSVNPESPFSLNGSRTPAPITQSARSSPHFPYFSASILFTLPAVHVVVLPHLNTRGGGVYGIRKLFLELLGGGV